SGLFLGGSNRALEALAVADVANPDRGLAAAGILEIGRRDLDVEHRMVGAAAPELPGAAGRGEKRPEPGARRGHQLADVAAAQPRRGIAENPGRRGVGDLDRA